MLCWCVRKRKGAECLKQCLYRVRIECGSIDLAIRPEPGQSSGSRPRALGCWRNGNFSNDATRLTTTKRSTPAKRKTETRQTGHSTRLYTNDSRRDPRVIWKILDPNLSNSVRFYIAAIDIAPETRLRVSR